MIRRDFSWRRWVVWVHILPLSILPPRWWTIRMKHYSSRTDPRLWKEVRPTRVKGEDLNFTDLVPGPFSCKSSDSTIPFQTQYLVISKNSHESVNPRRGTWRWVWFRPPSWSSFLPPRWSELRESLRVTSSLRIGSVPSGILIDGACVHLELRSFPFTSVLTNSTLGSGSRFRKYCPSPSLFRRRDWVLSVVLVQYYLNLVVSLLTSSGPSGPKVQT